MPIIYAGSTDIGQKRKTNQDSILIAAEHNLFVVADGMGGHNGGDIASQTAVATLTDYPYDPSVHKTPQKYLYECVKLCNKRIYEKSLENPNLKGMGTTVVCVFFHGEKLYIANVGDSRAYLLSKDHIFQLTKDHSLVQERVNHGIYTRIAARKDPMKNILIRSVGFEEKIEIDVFEYKLAQNDVVLICSDGLYNKMNDEALINAFKEHVGPNHENMQEKLDKMVVDFTNQANDAGGEDNISIIMLYAKP